MKKSVKIIVIVVVVLLAIRLALPYVVLHFANKTLAEMPGYHGHVEDIDIALIRGAYKIDSIYLNKLDSVSHVETPFFSASLIDLSVEWKAIFHGEIKGELVFERPVLRFTKDKVEPKQVAKDSSSFKKTLDGFMPLEINRFEINHGVVQYKDEHSSPKVDVELTNLHVLALNLKNSYDSSALLPATITASATVYEGTMDVSMKLNPLANDPTFDMNAEVKNTNLVKLNEFFKAYAKVDVNKGTFGMYAEAAAKEGAFTGYVKPLINDLDIVGMEDRDDNILQQLWEGVVGSVGQVFKNQPNDQVATKIPFQGRTDNPNADILTTLANVLQNAFIRAIQPAIDQEISIATVDGSPEKKTFIEKVFGKKDKK